MKKWLLVLGLLLVLVTGCTEYVAEEAAEAQLEAEGGDAEVDIDGGDVNIEYSDDDRDIVIQGENLGGDDWCNDNAAVNIVATGEDSGTYQWEVLGIVESGDYEGLCHMRTYMESDGATIEADYYTNEEGETVHMDMNTDGMEYDFDYSG